jgi:hypothetical protein
MKKFALALMASAAMVLGFGMVANASPPGGAVPVVSDTTPTAGSSFIVEVKCSPIGASVVFTVNSVPAQTVTAMCVAQTAALTTGLMVAQTGTLGVAK